MNRHRQNIRRALTLLLLLWSIPTIPRADQGSGWLESVITGCREIDASGGVSAFLSKKLSDKMDGGIKSALSLLPGNADDVAEAGQHTYSLMDRALRHIDHMLQTESTDGDDEFWAETQNEVDTMIYDVLVPDALKDKIDKGRELVGNAHWLVEKAESAIERGREMLEGVSDSGGGQRRDPLDALESYFADGDNDTPANDGSSPGDWDLVLREIDEAPAPTGGELEDLSDAAELTMTNPDTYSGYEAIPARGGTSYADSFQEASAETFEHGLAEAESLIASSIPETMNPFSGPASAGAGAMTGPKPSQVHAAPTGQPERTDCDPDTVMAKLNSFLKSIDFDSRNDDPCSVDREQIDISTRQLAVFEGCSLEGQWGSIAKPIQDLLDKSKASLKACLKKEEDRRRAEEEWRRAQCMECVQREWICPDFCGKR